MESAKRSEFLVNIVLGISDFAGYTPDAKIIDAVKNGAMSPLPEDGKKEIAAEQKQARSSAVKGCVSKTCKNCMH